MKLKLFLAALIWLQSALCFAITNDKPNHLNYPQIIQQFRQWEQEEPSIIDTFTIGQTTKGQQILGVRITDENVDAAKKKVLTTSCIHGNEPLATSTTIRIIAQILHNKQQFDGLLKVRELYLVPVVSPDSYPHSRHVDGVDPNRNFDGKSIPPIAALKNFTEKLRPDAVLSGHTFGRWLLYPYGDTNGLSPHNNEYVRLLNEMAKKSGYRPLQANKLYGYPIYGAEMDWYYRKLGCFSIVIEFGKHQRIPSKEDIDEEFKRTYGMYLFLIKHGPLILKDKK